MQETIGFIGVGHMGAAIARRLLASGWPLCVHDADPAAARALAVQGAEVAPDARTVGARAAIVLLCLPSVEASRSVARQVAQGEAVRTIVETSTVGPIAVREMAAELAAQSIDAVDAPVSGGPRAAEQGSLSVMCSGHAGPLQMLRPLLQAMAGPLFEVGHEPGLAQLCKLVNNAISAAGMVAACEATVVGAKAGLDPQMMLAAINAGSGRNAATLDKFPRSILPGTFDYGGPLGLMLKDLTLYLEQAAAAGVPQSVVPAALATWRAAVERTGFDADYSRLIRHLEIDAGAEVRTRPS